MKKLIILHSPGPLPGIPGESHGPGAFLVDYDARTIEAAPASLELFLPGGTTTLTPALPEPTSQQIGETA